jgi:tetratricopeptide (TPR) repeat protein
VQPLQLSGYLDAIVKSPEKRRQFITEMDANLREHPASFRAHFMLGIFGIKRGPEALKQAEQEFLQSIALNPEYAPAYLNLGNIYIYLDRRAEARQLYQKALALDPNPASVQQRQAIDSRR